MIHLQCYFIWSHSSTKDHIRALLSDYTASYKTGIGYVDWLIALYRYSIKIYDYTTILCNMTVSFNRQLICPFWYLLAFTLFKNTYRFPLKKRSLNMQIDYATLYVSVTESLAPFYIFVLAKRNTLIWPTLHWIHWNTRYAPFRG